MRMMIAVALFGLPAATFCSAEPARAFDMDVSPRDVHARLNYPNVARLAARIPAYVDNPYFCRQNDKLFISALSSIADKKGYIVSYKITKDIDGTVTLEVLIDQDRNDKEEQLRSALKNMAIYPTCNQYMTPYAQENIVEVRTVNGETSLATLIARPAPRH